MRGALVRDGVVENVVMLPDAGTPPTWEPHVQAIPVGDIRVGPGWWWTGVAFAEPVIVAPAVMRAGDQVTVVIQMTAHDGAHVDLEADLVVRVAGAEQRMRTGPDGTATFDLVAGEPGTIEIEVVNPVTGHTVSQATVEAT